MDNSLYVPYPPVISYAVATLYESDLLKVIGDTDGNVFAIPAKAAARLINYNPVSSTPDVCLVPGSVRVVYTPITGKDGLPGVLAHPMTDRVFGFCPADGGDETLVTVRSVFSPESNVWYVAREGGSLATSQS